MTTMTMYCIVSRAAIDAAGGARGKMMAQAGHAFLHAFLDATARFPGAAAAYVASDAPRKIVLVAATAADLAALASAYSDRCGTFLVVDAGHTVFAAPTVTCLGIGPIEAEDVGGDLRGLPALR
ncbi:hypothetical protein CHU95_20110 [Niveispirillum lacus]|uniref:peptidyl-tRNA hydrolase n=1 Tax=Niveispirillum lacus TaxID=1981099 RepID=A0A255YQG3_9PROT|nr:peptidyl-tRNA hydrolase [Niveispirillum lacus]OYQ31458.1 hypothetical protein CHU95_20110 [Niveispirillum lacus]